MTTELVFTATAPTIEAVSTDRSTVRPSPETNRHPDAVAAERRRRRGLLATRPCPACSQRNAPEAEYGSGLLTDPDTRTSSSEADCKECGGVGRVKRSEPEPDPDEGRGTE